MDDKTIMQNLLTSVKNYCDIMLHGAIESSAPAVNAAFRSSLAETLTLQSDVYNKMAEKGWYPSTQAPQTQITATKQKFQNCQ